LGVTLNTVPTPQLHEAPPPPAYVVPYRLPPLSKNEVRIRIRTIAAAREAMEKALGPALVGIGESLKTVPLEPPPPYAVVP
jgi:hypothetical protein